ncbi:MAG: 2,3-bisphosphoglycerate-independent phosphoglycerate mutase, partial [Patescibacteria group bacterium]|nr:2,3-bisphosphoglycerate-independent phosphoglycerate mutase [Patescibacteria group bacterium]
MEKNKVLLIICDGLGYNEDKDNNAVEVANTPNLDYYKANYPFATLFASGEAIGLPEGQMGTSEANHLVIGSGRIIYQNLVKINKAVKNGELIDNPAIKEAIEHVKEQNSVLHIKGLISDGGVHSHIDHIKALLKCAKENGVKNVYLHLYTDGRDTPPKSAIKYIEDIEDFMKMENIGRIATIGGRYWGMDRDNNNDRVEKHLMVMTHANGPKFKSAKEAIEYNYSKDIT